MSNKWFDTLTDTEPTPFGLLLHTIAKNFLIFTTINI